MVTETETVHVKDTFHISCKSASSVYAERNQWLLFMATIRLFYRNLSSLLAKKIFEMFSGWLYNKRWQNQHHQICKFHSEHELNMYILLEMGIQEGITALLYRRFL